MSVGGFFPFRQTWGSHPKWKMWLMRCMWWKYKVIPFGNSWVLIRRKNRGKNE